MTHPSLLLLALAACGGATHADREPATLEAPPPAPPPSADDVVAEVPASPAVADPSDGDAVTEAPPADLLSASSERATRGPSPRGEAKPEEGLLGGLGTRGVGRGGGGVGTGMGYGRGGAAVGTTGVRSEGRVAFDRRADVAPVDLPPLRAGKTDDNADFQDFLAFLRVWTDRPGFEGTYDPLDVAGRGYVDVSDAAGRPLPGVQVELLVGGAVVHRAATYGDGSAPLYPRLAGARQGELVVRVRDAGREQAVAWDGHGRVGVRLDVASEPEHAVPVDVVFALDTTGSMGDEIDRVKATLLDVTHRLGQLDRGVDLRLGAVLYRDRGDAYVTQPIRPTSDVGAFARALSQVSADGGGDTPEDLNAALAVTVEQVPWRAGAAKVVFVIADAPPHMDYPGERTYGEVARDALGRGIRIHTVAASGLDAVGSLVFRQVAQLTQGQFVFVEYGGDMIGSAAAHGVDGRQLSANNLDAILYDRIRAEVEGWRQRATVPEAVAVQAAGSPSR